LAPQAQQEVHQDTIEHIQSNGVASAPSFGQVASLLSDILEVPLDEIKTDTCLLDLGIDSLMATEVLGELQSRFDVAIPIDEFQGLQNVQALVDQLVPASTRSPSVATTVVESSEEISAQVKQISPVSDGITEVKVDAVYEIKGVQSRDQVRGDTAEVNFASVAQQSFERVRLDFDPICKDLSFDIFYEKVYPRQMDLVVAYIVEAFQTMGCPLADLESGESVPEVSVTSKHSKLKPRLYAILETAKLIQKNMAGDEWTRTSTPVPKVPSEKLRAALVADFPQHLFEHNLLASTGSKLADCLSGKIDPLSILFGNPKSRALMDSVYAHAPMFRAGTINAARYLVQLFQSLPEDFDRPVRILELGAGTGGTTKYILEQLVDKTLTRGRKFEYCFTDLSASLVAQAQR
jgi:acyl carrier protein